MAKKDVTLIIKGGLEGNFVKTDLDERELALTWLDDGSVRSDFKLWMGLGSGIPAVQLNDIPTYEFDGNLVLISDSNGDIIESDITLTELEILTGLSTRLTTIETNITNLGTRLTTVEGDIDTLEATVETLDENKLERSDIKQGTNVVLSYHPSPSTPAEEREVTISVPGIPLPDKFASTANGSGSVGSILNNQDSTLLTLIVGTGSLSVNDIVIYANGWQAEVTAVDNPNSEFTAVVVSIPVATAWGNISGTLSAQTDLVTEINTRVPKSTTVAGKALTGNVSLEKLILTDDGATLKEFDGSTEATFDLGEFVDDKLQDYALTVAQALSTKMDKITSPTTNNLLAMDAQGNAIDSNISKANVVVDGDILDGGTF
jgi:hypothetical protein